MALAPQLLFVALEATFTIVTYLLSAASRDFPILCPYRGQFIEISETGSHFQKFQADFRIEGSR